MSDWRDGVPIYQLWQVIAEIADMASLSDLRSIPFHKFLTQFAYKFDEVTSTLTNAPGRNTDENNYISIRVSELPKMAISTKSRTVPV